MNYKFHIGEHAYIIESGLYIKEVVVVNISGGFYQICFTDKSGSLKLRESRLFKTISEAVEHNSASKAASNEKKRRGFRSPYDYEW